jgi:hypothetical protein
MPFEITGRCEAAYLAVRCPRRTAACRTRCHRHAGYNNGGGAKPLIPQYIAERQQCFAVILDHATSLTHRCFFRRPTRKITVPSSVAPQGVGRLDQPHCNLCCPRGDVRGHAHALQRFAVILGHATSLTHRCFFRRPTRKITVPLKRGTPRSRPLGSTSLQPAVRDGRGCLTGAMRTSENSTFQALR